MSFPNRSVQFSNRSQIAYEQNHTNSEQQYIIFLQKGIAAMYTDMMACTQIGAIYKDTLTYTQKCCHIHGDADIYTEMLPSTQICCHIHRCVAIYTHMLPYTQICCHIHRYAANRYAAIYTEMLPYTQICCQRYAAIYTDMLPCTQICCHIHRYAVIYTDYGKKVLPRRNIPQLEKYRFLAPAHSIFFVLRRFVFLYRAPSGSTKKKNDLRGGRSWRFLIGIRNHRNGHTPPYPPPPPTHPSTHKTSPASEPSLQPCAHSHFFLFVFFCVRIPKKTKNVKFACRIHIFCFFGAGRPGAASHLMCFLNFFGKYENKAKQKIGGSSVCRAGGWGLIVPWGFRRDFSSQILVSKTKNENK